MFRGGEHYSRGGAREPEKTKVMQTVETTDSKNTHNVERK